MQIITATAEKIISNSNALVHHEGQAVFVPQLIPGEKAAIRITGEGKGFFYGEIEEIISSSPYRVKPPCSYYGICGGCTMQHIDYKYQLQLRKELVKEALLRNGKVNFDSITVIPSSTPFGYRCRAQFHTASNLLPDNSKILLGFMERAGNKIVPIQSCLVCNNSINNFISSSPKLKENKRITVFAPSSDYYLYPDPTPNKQFSNPVKVLLNNMEFETDAACFFQSNLEMTAKAAQLIAAKAEGECIIDLYCGVGILGTLAAKEREGEIKEIVFVESNPHALSYGEKNGAAISNYGIKKKYYPLSVEKYLQKFAKSLSGFHTVILDPPRTGLSKQVINALIAKKIKKIVYLSCDYPSLGRDIGFFVKNSYTLTELYLLDFYPQTHHAESLALLEYIE